MKRKVLLPFIILPLVCPVVMATSPTTSEPSKVSAHINGKEHAHMNAIEIILKDHEHIRQMFSQLDQNLDSNMTASKSHFKNLKDFLVKHETMEQTLWYPELEKDAELKKVIALLKKEEMDAANAIKKIDQTKDPKEWVAKVKELKKAVEHHADDEETKLFPKVKAKLNQATLEEIGEKLKSYHTEHHMKY